MEPPRLGIRVHQSVAKHIPMRRELKVHSRASYGTCRNRVAKHIPMRRELKDDRCDRFGPDVSGRKAHPDEKGTESEIQNVAAAAGSLSQSTSR